MFLLAAHLREHDLAGDDSGTGRGELENERGRRSKQKEAKRERVGQIVVLTEKNEEEGGRGERLRKREVAAEGFGYAGKEYKVSGIKKKKSGWRGHSIQRAAFHSQRVDR